MAVTSTNMHIDVKLSASASYIMTGKHVFTLTHLVRLLNEAFMAAPCKENASNSEPQKKSSFNR
jgi:hypothetical protein